VEDFAREACCVNDPQLSGLSVGEMPLPAKAAPVTAMLGTLLSSTASMGVSTAATAPLSLRCPCFDDQGEWRAYRKFSNTDVPFNALHRMDATNSTGMGASAASEHSIASLSSFSFDGADDPSLAAAAAACGRTPGCVAFNSLGQLKSCAGCDLSPECCVYPQGQPFDPANGIDLFVATGRAPPPEWVAGINDGSLLYAEPEPAEPTSSLCYMPEVRACGCVVLRATRLWARRCRAGDFHRACTRRRMLFVTLYAMAATKTTTTTTTTTMAKT
jgi:hypothetical protein